MSVADATSNLNHNLFSTRSAQFGQERLLTGAYKKDIILDVDMDWGDVLSLCLIIKNPNIHLLGVCVSNVSETHLKPGLVNAKRILKQANLGHVPVVPGARVPVSSPDPLSGCDNNQRNPNSTNSSCDVNVFPERNFRTSMDTLDFGHGSLLDKLGFPPLTEAEEAAIQHDMDAGVGAQQQPAWSFMKETLETNEKQITIIVTGGLTDIESLFREDAKFRNIERIVIMGGALDGLDGNFAALNDHSADLDHGRVCETNVKAEWNICMDPVAAKMVFENRHNVPLVLVPLNACNNVLLSSDTPKLLRHGDNITLLAKGILEGQIQKEPSIPISDPLSVLIATGNIQSYSFKHARIIVRTEQTELQNDIGQTIAVPSSGTIKRGFEEVQIVTTASSVEFNNVFTYLMNMPSPKFLDVLSENPNRIAIPKPVSNADNSFQFFYSGLFPEYELSSSFVRTAYPIMNVAFVVFDKMELLDYTGLIQVFGSARYPYVENDRRINFSKGKPVFNTFSIAGGAESVRLGMSSGDQTTFKESALEFKPDYVFDDDNIPPIDVLVVIGGQGIDDLLENETMRNVYVDFISKNAKKVDYVLGGCSGVLLLAHTGLLSNLEVTTHHTRFEQLNDISKEHNMKMQVVDTRLGRNFIHNPLSKMMTSGGVHCVIAMGLHVVELYMGKIQKDYIADTLMEYTVPVGYFSYPSELRNLQSSSYYDPRFYVKGFSHLNVIMKDLKMMEEATSFYRKTLGFQEAWSVWLPEEANEHFVVDAGLYTREEIRAIKERGLDQPVELLVRFLVHPNISIHIELMTYKGLDLDRFDPKDKPSFLNTFDVGGFRHVALEVENCALLWEHLKSIEGVDLLQKTSLPEVLYPYPQTFFYFRDPYGCQWEFEQGRAISTVIKGVVS